MPVSLKLDCPTCGEALVRKPGGRCPACNTPVAQFVQAARNREEQIERVVAVIGTILVGSLFVFTSGLGAFEGVLAYAGAGAVMFYLARKTF